MCSLPLFGIALLISLLVARSVTMPVLSSADGDFVFDDLSGQPNGHERHKRDHSKEYWRYYGYGGTGLYNPYAYAAPLTSDAAGLLTGLTLQRAITGDASATLSPSAQGLLAGMALQRALYGG
ncbi:uncharacterized protein LOC129582748 [Paramacrobiotus metropolitanus]|uniref:uncharacterized protein LOC129582748 n=1 Tax=Paramacrobiotus metropolitanus TaxID=2943436 RepID=UPI002445CA43|nr:uncharacterized protein LOC129582748 [Paramacrobiotus metropolitanus]